MTAGTAGVSVATTAGAPALVIAGESSALRRTLGPVAWSALEVLVLASRIGTADGLTVTLSVRDLAVELGVGKDAAAAALRVLRSHGLVAADPLRGSRGRFDRTRYRINLPVVVPEPTPRPRRTHTHAQALSLFDTPADGDALPDDRDDHPVDLPQHLPKILHELAFRNAPNGPSRDGNSC